MKAIMTKFNIDNKNLFAKTLIYILGIIIFFGYWEFFGVSNAIIGFLIVNAATMLFHKDLTAKPLRNILKFLFIYFFIGICTFISSYNIYLGFFVNFFCIFFMVYTLFYDFKTTILPPFLLSYLILLRHPVTMNELPTRLLCLGIGSLFIVVSQLIINHNRSKKALRANLIGLVKEISLKIDALINNKDIRYDYVNVEKYIDNIVNILNERKDSRFCMENIDSIRLNFALYVERLNYSLDELYHPANDKIYKKFLKDLSTLMDKIIRFIETEDAIYLLILEIDEFTEKYETFLSFNYSAYELIQNMSMLKFSLSNFAKEKENCKCKSKISYFIPIPDMSMFKNILTLNFNFKSLKFTYAFRLSFLIAGSYFVVKFLNIPFGYWITITLFAVIQPYTENSRQRFLLRFRGTIIGIIIFMIITLFVPILSIKIVIYLLLYYMYLFFKNYDNKMACITPIVLGIFTLLGDNAYETTLYRFIYMAIGILIGYLGTKYLFPYNTLDSLKNFTKSYFNLSKDTITYAFNNKIDEELFKELNDRLIKGKLYEDKILLNNGSNNVKYIKDFTYNQRILMNNIYFLFYSLYKTPIDDSVLNQFKKELTDIYKVNSRDYIEYDEETFLKQIRIKNKNNFNSIDSYQGKLVLINLNRIYSRLQISKDLGERIKIIIFTFYN